MEEDIENNIENIKKSIEDISHVIVAILIGIVIMVLGILVFIGVIDYIGTRSESDKAIMTTIKSTVEQSNTTCIERIEFIKKLYEKAGI